MKKKSNFPDRVRFNWGFHDAAQCVERGWDLEGAAFAKGLSDKMGGAPTTPEKVIQFHPDPAYAYGWRAGYVCAKQKGDHKSSQPAWELLKKENWPLFSAGTISLEGEA